MSQVCRLCPGQTRGAQRFFLRDSSAHFNYQGRWYAPYPAAEQKETPLANKAPVVCRPIGRLAWMDLRS